MPETKKEKVATVTRGWDNVEPVWFCEGLPESAWRRAMFLWGAPAVPFFGFPRAVGAARVGREGIGKL